MIRQRFKIRSNVDEYCGLVLGRSERGGLFAAKCLRKGGRIGKRWSNCGVIATFVLDRLTPHAPPGIMQYDTLSYFLFGGVPVAEPDIF